MSSQHPHNQVTVELFKVGTTWARTVADVDGKTLHFCFMRSRRAMLWAIAERRVDDAYRHARVAFRTAIRITTYINARTPEFNRLQALRRAGRRLRARQLNGN